MSSRMNPRLENRLEQETGTEKVRQMISSMAHPLHQKTEEFSFPIEIRMSRKFIFYPKLTCNVKMMNSLNLQSIPNSQSISNYNLK